MTNWNFADVYEAVAARVPDWPCQVQGERVVTWGQFDRRANALAADLVDAGLTHQSKVAAYLYNGPEYLESYVAAFKGGFAPVNTNFRYGQEEIVYLFDNADAEAVVFHAAFGELLDGVRNRLPMVRRWYCVADGTAPVPAWAVEYESVVQGGADRAETPWGRSPDDLLLLYTGGTTGMPKGVMWRQDDLFNVIGGGGNPFVGRPPAASVQEIADNIDPSGQPIVMLPACPLMHGTGQFSALITMNLGGTIVMLPSRRFDADELWREVARNHVNAIVIVGQAFAAPMLAWLDEHEGELDLSTVFLINSSGVMWSQDNKDGLLRHLPQAILFDSFGSSEAVGLGASVSTSGAAQETAKFVLGENVAVFAEDGRRVEPGSPEPGLVAVSGYIPVGYYKDEAKTAATFPVIDGVRYSLPGDWATVEADGSVTLLGRGSVCINTGGEKVFPEEVEEVLKTAGGVVDAVCVGVPDERFGEAVTAVVAPSPGETPDEDEIAEAVERSGLSRFKRPRHVVVVEAVPRGPNGKADYAWARETARARLGP
jgi:3-oxocholest-4-en-26-oate---CoA ligase